LNDDDRSRTSGQLRIGQPVRRLEDHDLLTGRAVFIDDLNLRGVAHAVFVRSPHAHARIRAIDAAAAQSAPGVLAVFTGADLQAAGVGPIRPAIARPPDRFWRTTGCASSATQSPWSSQARCTRRAMRQIG
jgi:CO/xanthine dehydrogenase Mo-binding subunit